jgi:hypothetical protein
MPSFSKESFGGFVGFQEVAIDPNQKMVSKLFAPSATSRRLAGPSRRLGSKVTYILFFRNINLTEYKSDAARRRRAVIASKAKQPRLGAPAAA